MVDWQAMEGIGGIATALALVVALAFGLVQVRQAQRKRLDVATMQLLQSIHGNPDFLRALRVVLALPDEAETPLDGPREDALWLVSEAYENLGILVFERTINIRLADAYFGGGVRSAWRKARPFVERARAGNPKVGEWFQWLAERLDEQGTLDSVVPAHVAHREWKP